MEKSSTTNDPSHATSRDGQKEQSAAEPTNASVGSTDDSFRTSRWKCPVFTNFKQVASPYMEQHGHAMLYGFIGFLIALLILIIGFWQTVLLVAFAAVGVVIGCYRDGNPTVRRRLKDFIDRID